MLPIAVTGSVGKTTTTDLLGAALRTIGPTVALEHGPNRASGLAHAVAAAGPETRFLVQEIGVASSGAGSLDELLWALEPRAALITNARSDHLSALGGPDGAAREKVKAVKALPATGLAVLNADDPRIRAMATAAPCRVVLAGRADDAEVRVVETTLGPDGRLVARLAADGAEHVLSTQLVGPHWETAVVLAFAAAIRLGADPAAAARAIEAKAPSDERLSVVTTATGARFLVDTAKSTEASMDASLAGLAAMTATRRVAVIGSLFDYSDASPEETVMRVVREALAVASEVILYGNSAMNAPPETLADPRVRRFSEPRPLADALWAEIGPGDLVLLKGALLADHLARVSLRATHDVRCWRTSCGKRLPCTMCRHLGPVL